MRFPVMIGAALLLAACGNPGPTDAEIEKAEFAAARAGAIASAKRHAVDAPVTQIALSDMDKGRVCRAVIASLNGRDPAIIRVISNSGGVHRVRYTRDDGTIWTNECRIGNGTAEWRIVENGQPGRWRDEDTIHFQVDGPTVKVQTFMGGEPVTDDGYRIN